ncbi:hypothetical protein Tco_1418865 [Tanacetum coccineum]
MDQDALDSAACDNFLDKMPQRSSSPVKTSDNFVKFANELAPLNSLPPGNDDSTLKKDLHEENFQEDVEIKNSNVSSEKAHDNVEIAEFLANRSYLQLRDDILKSEGDIAFLDNLLSDDDSHNLDSKVTSDHEPEQNESSIKLVSPRSLLTEHMKFQLPGKISSKFVYRVLFPCLPILIEDSDPTQEEIDILLVPDDLNPPGIEDADSEDEINESPNLDHQDDPSIPRPPPEPPDIKKCFEPKAGILIIKEFKGVSKSHDFMTGFKPNISRILSCSMPNSEALEFLILCVKLVWGDQYPFIIID